MTVAEARNHFAARPQFGDPRTGEAARILSQIIEVRKLIVRNAALKPIVRPTPGTGFSLKLSMYPADVVNAAFAELGVP